MNNNDCRREEFEKRRKYKGTISMCEGYDCPVFMNCLLEIKNLQEENKKQKEVISRAVKYIENEMPYLQETDKEYEDVNGNTYFTYKEYDGKELLDILKEVSE